MSKKFNFFNYDGALVTSLRFIGSMILLNICFIISCIPVITVGTAVTALYSCFINDRKGRGYLKTYFNAFRTNFKTTIIPWLIYMAFLVFLAMDLYFMIVVKIPGEDVLLLLFVVIAVIWLISGTWFFILRARYDSPVRQCLKNSLIIGFGRFLYTVPMAIPWLLLPASMFFSRREILTGIFVFLQFGFSLSAGISAFFAKKVLYKLEEE